MAQQEELGRFLVGLTTEITNIITGGLQEVGQNFSSQLSQVSTVISAQGMSQIVGVFVGDPTKFRDWIKSTEKHILLAGQDDDQTKRLAYQTSRGAVSDYIQRYMTEHPNSSWEDLRSELNLRFAEVNDSHHAFTMLGKARQTKSKTVQVYVERLYALANDAFAKVDKGVIESQLVGFFIDGLFHDNLRMKVMRKNPKTFQAAVQSALAEQNLRKGFQLRTVHSQSSKSRTEEPM